MNGFMDGFMDVITVFASTLDFCSACELVSASYTTFLMNYFRVPQQPPAPFLGICPQETGCQSVRCPQDSSRCGVHTDHVESDK